MDKPPMKDFIPVAGNGLIHRRAFLSGSALLASSALLTATPAAAATLQVPESMKSPGAGMSGYGERSRYEAHVQRSVRTAPGTIGTGVSMTPLESLEGIVTPNALHFERHHNGVPTIDPTTHRLLIHGLVDRKLVFDLDALERYPMVSRIQFLECSGNSAANNASTPPQATAGVIHGLLSCSEWTGIPLSILLEEAGVKREAGWIICEGSDAAGMSRSIPLDKAFDDAILALYQNGERLRPGNGYPMRLLLPGWEGNTSVKWLRRIQVSSGPAMTKDETSKYSDLMPDGRAKQFTFQMGVKSVITSPSGGGSMKGAGLYQISGIAWTGAGRIRDVEVSADGGRSWEKAELSSPVLPKALTRFRLPWLWDGGPGLLQSRATDETGEIQPSREKLIGMRGPEYRYHYNAIQTWRVDVEGQIYNAYL